jgi:hypothetical protein
VFTIINTGYLRAYGVDEWYLWLCVPMTLGGLILLIKDAYDSE